MNIDTTKPDRYTAATLIEAEVSQVSQRIVERLFRTDHRVEIQRLPAGDLPLSEQEYNPPTMSALIWSPASTPHATMFYPNLTDGWQTLVHGLATEDLMDCVSIRLGTYKQAYPIRELLVYRDGKHKRLVRTMLGDTRWEFYELGQRLSFEYDSAYNRRLIRNRLTVDLLIEYCENLGWPFRAENTWFTNHAAYLLSRVKTSRTASS